MDDSPSGLLKFFVPRVPGIARAALVHSLGYSANSTKWDFRTEMTVHVLRSLMDPSNKLQPIGKIQQRTLKDPGVKDNTWVAKAVIPVPEQETLTAATFKAIEDLGDGTEAYVKPSLDALDVEWTGHRSSARPHEQSPAASDQERYASMMDDPARTSKTTILYFHGGAYYLCSFGTHRESVRRLVEESNGRAMSVGYRLAPKHAFPSQLLDALNSYLYLLYPPENALHEPVPANEIVFAGDSAGGNVVFALLQLLLQLHRTSSSTPTVQYHGKEVEVPLPAGVTANSGWFDISRAMPSLDHNAKFDYLPPASHDTFAKFPQDDLWPTNPPRGDIFCDLSLMTHPLVSPLAASNWTGSPPMWIETGQELLTDEDAIVAVRAASQGVVVQWEQYEAMPHCFAMVIPTLQTSTRCVKSWGTFCRTCVEGKVETNGTWIAAKSGLEKQVDVSSVTDIKFEDAVARMEDAKARRLKGYEKEGKSLPTLRA